MIIENEITRKYSAQCGLCDSEIGPGKWVWYGDSPTCKKCILNNKYV